MWWCVIRFSDLTEGSTSQNVDSLDDGCGFVWSEIDFSRVPSVCLKRFRKAMLNEKLRR